MAANQGQRPSGLKRRTFLKAAGAVGGAAAVLGAGALEIGRQPSTAAAATQSPITEVVSSCTLECIHCSLVAEIQDGKVINVKGNPKHNTQPCLRGRSRVQMMYGEDRVLYPRRNVGEKGNPKWERISWDEALDLIAEKINETIAKHGPKGILYMSGSGNFASLAGSVGPAFFSYLGGCTRTVGGLCCNAVTAGMTPTLGARTEFRDTLNQSKYIICWGNNPAVTMQGYWKQFAEAMSKGAKLVVIDPRFSETAAKAHEWVPIKPGTDTALAMGMLAVIIKEKIYDEPFLLTKTGATFLLDRATGDQLADAEGKPLVMDGRTNQPVSFDTEGAQPVLSLAGNPQYLTVFDMIAAEVEPFTPEKVEEITRVPASTVVRLAREIAGTKPMAIVQNMSGAQRTEFGTYTVVSQVYLNAFTGNFGMPGAGVNDTGGVTQLVKFGAPVPSAKTDPIASIPAPKLGEYLLEGKPHEIGMVWVASSSITTQYPNTNKVQQALKKTPFVVVAHPRMDSDTQWADLVLPVTLPFENLDVLASSGIRSHYVQLMDKGVEPQGESHQDSWIFRELAKRFDFADVFSPTDEEMCNNVLAPVGLTVAGLRESGPVNLMPKPYIPFEGGVFKTPTKRLQFFVPAWKEQGMHPIVHYYVPNESPEGDQALAAKYPLQLTNRKNTRTVHSSYGQVPWLKEVVKPEQTLLMHPRDAAARGIQDGDYVVVFNDRGELRVKVEVTEWIIDGVVSLENGWWSSEGGSSSILSNDKIEPLATGHTLNSTLVQVRKEA